MTTRFCNPPKACPASGNLDALKLALCHAFFHRKTITFVVNPADLAIGINIALDTEATVAVDGCILTIAPPPFELTAHHDPYFENLKDEIIAPAIPEEPEPEFDMKVRQREYQRRYRARLSKEVLRERARKYYLKKKRALRAERVKKKTM